MYRVVKHVVVDGGCNFVPCGEICGAELSHLLLLHSHTYRQQNVGAGWVIWNERLHSGGLHEGDKGRRVIPYLG